MKRFFYTFAISLFAISAQAQTIVVAGSSTKGIRSTSTGQKADSYQIGFFEVREVPMERSQLRNFWDTFTPIIKGDFRGLELGKYDGDVGVPQDIPSGFDDAAFGFRRAIGKREEIDPSLSPSDATFVPYLLGIKFFGPGGETNIVTAEKNPNWILGDPIAVPPPLPPYLDLQGSGIVWQYSQSSFRTVVPEPSTALGLVVGMFLLSTRRRNT